MLAGTAEGATLDGTGTLEGTTPPPAATRLAAGVSSTDAKAPCAKTRRRELGIE